jgi:hypothetical protein
VSQCPSGGELVGATVVISGVGSCETVDNGAGSACCSLDIGTAGTETLTVSAPGFIPFTGTLAMICESTIPVGLQPTGTTATVVFTVTGCCSLPLPGAVIQLSDGQTCTTDSAGQCSFWLTLPGTYTYMIGKVRFVTATGSFTIGSACPGGGATVDVTLSPESGFACGPQYDQNLANPRPDPIPTTLNITDSTYGATTLIYNGSFWTGTINGATFGAACSCPGNTFSITYNLYPCTGLTGGIVFQASFTSGSYGECLSGEFFPTATSCPYDGPAITPCGAEEETGYGALGSVFISALGQVAGAPAWSFGIDPGSWSLVPGLPFDMTLQTGSGCPSGGFTNTPYPASATYTITE